MSTEWDMDTESGGRAYRPLDVSVHAVLSTLVRLLSTLVRLPSAESFVSAVFAGQVVQPEDPPVASQPDRGDAQPEDVSMSDVQRETATAGEATAARKGVARRPAPTTQSASQTSPAPGSSLPAAARAHVPR